ncbi:hypothetical protein ABZ505_34980, partial [Nocardia niwae]
DEIGARLAELTRMSSSDDLADADLAHYRTAERLDVPSADQSARDDELERPRAIGRARENADRSSLAAARDNTSLAAHKVRDTESRVAHKVSDESTAVAREVSDTDGVARAADKDLARERPASDADADPNAQLEAVVAHDDADEVVDDRAGAEREDDQVTDSAVARESSSRAAHITSEQDVDGESRAEREDDVARDDNEDDEPIGDIARDVRAVVSLVRTPSVARSAREVHAATVRPSRASRAPVARQAAVTGALAHATDRAPVTKSAPKAETAHGVFARELTYAEAMKLAGAVAERRLSRQPIDVLARIYEAASHSSTTPNSIATAMGLPHSTVDRAIQAAGKVAGPRPLS